MISSNKINIKASTSESSDRFEKNAANLAMLEDINFSDSFDSSMELTEKPKSRSHEIDIDKISFNSFDSFDSDEDFIRELDRISSTPKVSPKKNLPDPSILRASQSINKRPATSPIKEAISIKEPKRRFLENYNEDKPNIINPKIEINPTLSSANSNKKADITPLSISMPMEVFNFNNTTRASLVQKREFSISSKVPKKNEALYHTIQLSTQVPNHLSEDKLSNSANNVVKNVKPIILSREQESVLKLVLDGESLFYTGSAGTGKSVLLKAIVKSLKRKHKQGDVAVTASTGLAACNIGGNTLHSFAGTGLGLSEVTQLIKKIRRNKKALMRWMSVKVLIIDEISMIDGHFLNKLDEIAKTLRKSQRPFGGIQIVVCGDFYQLPPVVKKTEPDGTEKRHIEEPMFAFESYAWKNAINSTIILQEVFRQKGDQKFIEMLNEMRDGSVSHETTKEFKRLSRPLLNSGGIEPAELFATRKEVDRSNNTKLSTLEGDAQLYCAADSGTLPTPQKQNLLSNFLAPQNLYLKKHAQVMCIKNFDDTLVNGALGQVVDFMDRNTYMKTYSKSPETDCTNMIDEVVTKKDSEIDSDFIFDFKEMKKSQEEIENMARKESLSKDFESNASNKKYPLVRFLLPDGINTRMVLVEPEQWTVEDEQQNVLLSRVQLPLILAWAISIHKSQGQSLPLVKVDLKSVFENGQSYVALSRAVSRVGLQVLNFDKYKVRAHPKVVSFYKTLSSAEESSLKRKSAVESHFLFHNTDEENEVLSNT